MFKNMRLVIVNMRLNMRLVINNSKQVGVYPKFLIFKLPNVSNKNAVSIRKRLLRSAINKRNKELQHVWKDLSLSEHFSSKQLSTIGFYILTKSITSHNNKSLLKSLYTQQEKLSSLTKDCSLPIFTANETITNLTQYELSQEESDLPKAVYTFQSNRIKFENPKSSLPLNRHIVPLLTILNRTKPKFR